MWVLGKEVGMMNRDGRLLAGLLGLCLILSAGCGDDSTNPEPEPPDVTPPEDILDLGSTQVLSRQLNLNWTAPGDDLDVGQADKYDLRMSQKEITPENWQDARELEISDPVTAGQLERVTVQGLTPLTLYYFVVSARDEVGNWSGISNIHSVRTAEPPDAGPPAAVTDLVQVSVTDNSVVLMWTAVGDDGNEGLAFAYDIRFSVDPITEETFFDIIGDGIPDKSPVPGPPGTTEIWEIPNLTPSTTYNFGMKVLDDEGQYSPLSNVIVVVTDPPPIP